MTGKKKKKEGKGEPSESNVVHSDDIIVVPAEAVEVLQPELEGDAWPETFEDLKPGLAESYYEEEADNSDRPSGKNQRSELVPYNPLAAFLREMRKLPPLTREEEKELAVRYRENKDLDAAYQLVSRNLWLVVKIAREYEKAARSLLDLIQEGNIGLLEAVKNFDPYRGVRFPSYAVWWIKAFIIRYLVANWRMVKIGTTQAQRKLFFNLNKEKERLEREGYYPAPKLLAERLDVRESDVIEMQQRLGSPDLSMDTPMDEDGAPLLSFMPGSEANAEEVVVAREQQALLEESLQKFAQTLKANERIIFEARLLSEEKATLQELSERLSLSKERVRQVENKIKEKLKDFLLENYNSVVEFMS